ncbi:HPr kinase/phosphorylase [Paenirhodobacter enshiensis]|uniref:Serine kinase n=1 Tax=Paenirhodobacter enshiensis TaxID=1105367 RepID=A0A086Y9H2_9RHOB|nr:serine kinase [Paenirhodobacter enshiensis]KFI30922.1 serine kinase [Paenirhodobacter enshiensis]
MSEPDAWVHAGAVALDADRGVLILGPSGAGKSALALRLMAFGAVLVSDDRVRLSAEAGALIARAPGTIRGRIEARGLGILGAGTLAQARIVLAVDLSLPEAERLPPHRVCHLCGLAVPLVHGAGCDHLDVAVLQWLKGGRLA